VTNSRGAAPGLRRRCALIVCCVGLFGADLLRADLLSGFAFRLVATNASGTGTVEVPFSSGTWDPTGVNFRWTRSSPLQVVDPTNGTLIATLINADVTVKTGSVSEIQFAFGVLAGTSTTTFSASSPKSTFRRVPAAVATGRATCSLTVTDMNGDGAQLFALGQDGTGSYHGSFNGLYPNGLEFASLVSLVFAGAGGSATGTQNDPPFGYRLVGTYVDDASILVSFRVTSADRAYANTRIGFPDPPSRCAADVNADGIVDASDLSLLLSGYGEAAGGARYNINCDFDNNGVVDLSDLSYLLYYYGAGCVPV